MFNMMKTAILMAATAMLAACGGGQRGPAPTGSVPAPEPILSTAAPGRVPRQPDVVALYRRMGLLAEAGETPFVGSLSFFAGPSDDSTSIVVTVSLANRSLRFRPGFFDFNSRVPNIAQPLTNIFLQRPSQHSVNRRLCSGRQPAPVGLAS